MSDVIEEEDDDDEAAPEKESAPHPGNAKSLSFFSEAACQARIANFRAALDRPKNDPKPATAAANADVDADHADDEANAPGV